MKSYTFWAATPSSYRSMLSVISGMTLFSLDRIHLSSSSSFSGSSHLSMVRFIIRKREAFQILLAKLRMASHRSV